MLINWLKITGRLIKIENVLSDFITNILVNKIYYNYYCLYKEIKYPINAQYW